MKIFVEDVERIYKQLGLSRQPVNSVTPPILDDEKAVNIYICRNCNCASTLCKSLLEMQKDKGSIFRVPALCHSCLSSLPVEDQRLPTWQRLVLLGKLKVVGGQGPVRGGEVPAPAVLAAPAAGPASIDGLTAAQNPVLAAGAAVFEPLVRLPLEAPEHPAAPVVSAAGSDSADGDDQQPVRGGVKTAVLDTTPALKPMVEKAATTVPAAVETAVSTPAPKLKPVVVKPVGKAAATEPADKAAATGSAAGTTPTPKPKPKSQRKAATAQAAAIKPAAAAAPETAVSTPVPKPETLVPNIKHWQGGETGERRETMAEESVRDEYNHREMMRCNPNDQHTHIALGDILRKRGDLPGAEVVYREVVRLAERLDRLDRRAEAHNYLGKFLQKKGDLAGAEAALREAVRVTPDQDGYRSFRANLNGDLGKLLLEKGDLKDAEAVTMEALRWAHHNVDRLHVRWAHHNVDRLHDLLGQILREKGDYIGAEAAYREAVQLVSPQNPYCKVYGIQLTEIAEIICSQGAGSQRE